MRVSSLHLTLPAIVSFVCFPVQVDICSKQRCHLAGMGLDRSEKFRYNTGVVLFSLSEILSLLTSRILKPGGPHAPLLPLNKSILSGERRLGDSCRNLHGNHHLVRLYCPTKRHPANGHRGGIHELGMTLLSRSRPCVGRNLQPPS